MRFQAIRVTALLAGSAFCGPGCGDTPRAVSTTEEASVKGTVTLHGKPVTQGELIFDPANTSRRNAPTAKVTIDKDGSYSVKTLVGENTVLVSGPQISNDTKITQAKKFLDIKSGENTIPIELP